MIACHRLRATAAGMTLAIAALGCGGGTTDERPRVAVSGTVTLNGQPLDNAVILFVPFPEVDGPKASVSVTEGRFEIPPEAGPVPGRHRVEIESTDHGGIAPDDEAAMAALASGKRKLARPVRIPAIYNVRSKLERTVQADSPNEFEFSLVTKR